MINQGDACKGLQCLPAFSADAPVSSPLNGPGRKESWADRRGPRNSSASLSCSMEGGQARSSGCSPLTHAALLFRAAGGRPLQGAEEEQGLEVPGLGVPEWPHPMAFGCILELCEGPGRVTPVAVPRSLF